MHLITLAYDTPQMINKRILQLQRLFFERRYLYVRELRFLDIAFYEKALPDVLRFLSRNISTVHKAKGMRIDLGFKIFQKILGLKPLPEYQLGNYKAFRYSRFFPLGLVKDGGGPSPFIENMGDHIEYI